uniref:tRNA pseudouridine(55) synthase n=1 Tax=Opuntia streptacantha TaxID=393608 RepID=A0A7C9A9I8_OPUST
MAAKEAEDAAVSGDINQPENVTASDEELRLLDDVVRSFPSAPVKHLLSLGVCPQCILRLFGKYGPSYCSVSHLLGMLSEVAGHRPNPNDPTFQQSVCEGSICSVCYGILQFIYMDEKQTMVRKECANDLAASIHELARQEGYQIDGFFLEVSIPSFIVEEDNAIRLSMKEKYESEDWFKEILQSETISVKDAIKLYITEPLETLFGVKSGPSSFRVRLTYTPSGVLKSENGEECNKACKRRKKDVLKKCMDTRSSRPSNGKASACFLKIQCYRTPIFILGRYLKYSRNISQTCWIIDDERMGELSVEEITGGGILPLCRGDNYKFHAAGREDIDVRMLGSGRPFLLEIQNPRVLSSELSVKEMEEKVNTLGGELIKVKNLKVVDDQVWTLMREGEAEKQKQYAALVWTSRELEDKDLQMISSRKDMKILQNTPVRVLHRRSPLEREKIIHWMTIEKITGSTQYFLLHLCTQAGTYIKEFVHGDLGRTYPSLGSILGCRAEILQLDVTDVKMDCRNR